MAQLVTLWTNLMDTSLILVGPRTDTAVARDLLKMVKHPEAAQSNLMVESRRQAKVTD